MCLASLLRKTRARTGNSGVGLLQGPPAQPAVLFPPQEHMTAGGNCQTFSSSTVISYSNTGDGAPKVYQETSEMRSAPGGVSWRPALGARLETPPRG